MANQFCGIRGGNLVAHHIISLSILFKIEKINKNLFNELIYDKNNGYSLCVPCHKELHYAN